VKGNVRAEPASGNQAEVIAVKEGRDDPDHVTIQGPFRWRLYYMVNYSI
jgi:hypothetical protein